MRSQKCDHKMAKNVITNVTKSTRKLSLRAYSVQLLKKKELKTTRHERFW